MIAVTSDVVQAVYALLLVAQSDITSHPYAIGAIEGLGRALELTSPGDGHFKPIGAILTDASQAIIGSVLRDCHAAWQDAGATHIAIGKTPNSVEVGQRYLTRASLARLLASQVNP